MTSEARWLSATAAARFVLCQAAAAPRMAPSIPVPTAPGNAGSLAHAAMSSWIESGGWRRPDAGPALQSNWDAEVVKWGLERRILRDGVVTRARLGTRGAELATLLTRAGTRARSELFIKDDVHGLYGQLDVVVDGSVDAGLVIDLKTGREGGDFLSAVTRGQLLTYAHLFRVETGVLPQRVVVFSLRRGVLELGADPSEVDDFVARVASLVDESIRAAVPDQRVCRFCPRRLACEPHWTAARTWEDPDCVEGRVIRVQHAATGATSIQLDTAGVTGWLTGLRPEHLDGTPALGQLIRAVRLGRRGSSEEPEWAATRVTRAVIRP
ncbi:PD-(D/E)XK nuclease family protein [Agromyces sp. SYSU T0242]|uniref:PD-(D/E)XK nuclease family protein n=1 Tax=Agromyces litoreus TaxID=3158561 RepID=UPI00339B00DE